jgi:leucyl-tRNA synthetase
MVLMLAPMCPHVAEELWTKLGHEGSLAHGPFPAADERYLVDDTVEYPIQVNGKVRARITVPADATREQVHDLAMADDKVTSLINGATPKKVIVVPGRLVNIVV